MRRQLSCEACRDGVRCRSCQAVLLPPAALLTERDVMVLLALIDSSDRKYAPKTLDTIATVLNVKQTSAKGVLQRIRKKLRSQIRAHDRTQAPPADPIDELPNNPASAREEVLRRVRSGELTDEEGLQLLETL